MGAYGSPETYPYPKDPVSEKKSRKTPQTPIYKRLWFWVGLVMAAVMLIGGGPSVDNLLTLAGFYCVYGFVHNMIVFLRNMWMNRAFKNNLLIALACAVAFFVSAMALGAQYRSVPQPAFGIAQPFPSQLNPEIYDSLQKGMTYDEACKFIGAEGALYQESGFGETATKAYYWGTSEQYIYAGFVDGKMYDKGRVGVA